MRHALLWLATTLFSVSAAAEPVHFPSATAPPSPLRQRLASERGQAIERQPGVELAGELYRPAGDGPFPAVVILHGCNGRLPRAIEDAEGARFTARGYAVLTVDSFGPRGVKERCRAEDGPPVDRVMDAYGALLYLAGQPFIDPERIALLGYSQGAMVALSATELHGLGTLFDRRFAAVVAYYPYCTNALVLSAPTVILIGELDDWTPANACRRDMAYRSGEGAPVKLVVYPGAYHAFNFLRAGPSTYSAIISSTTKPPPSPPGPRRRLRCAKLSVVRAEWDEMEPRAVPSHPIRAHRRYLLQEARWVQLIPAGPIML